MKKIAILICDRVLASSVTGPMDLFNIANDLWYRLAKEKVAPLFQVELVAESLNPVTTSSGLTLTPTKTLAELGTCDLLLLSAYHFDNTRGLLQFIARQAPIFGKIEQIYRTGTPIAGHCSATFTLAATGLLNGKKATTTWWLKEKFAEFYPEVELVMEHLVVESDQLWTGGATTSYYDLCLKLIEQMAGKQIATLLSRVMLLDTSRTSQLPYISIPDLIEHKDEAIADCQLWLQNNFSAEISLDDMSDKSAMSKRNFIRRFKKAVGETPLAYLQRIRVEAAKRYLETSELNFQQIVDRIGYDDTSAFRRVFQKITSLSPSAYRNKFSESYRQH